MATEESSDPLPLVGERAPAWTAPFACIKDIIENRFLVKNLVKREVKGKYSNAMFGYAWSVIEPTLLAVVYYFLFIMLAGNPDQYYAVWVLIGVIVWGCFGKSLMASVTSLSGNSGTIHLVYFPRIIFPTTSVSACIVISAMSSLVIIPIFLYYDLSPSIHLILFPLCLILAGFLGIGIGLMFAPLNCVQRDVEHLFRFIVRAGFFVSPVMWTYEMAIERGTFGDFVFLNPMVAPITIARHSLLGIWPAIPTNAIIWSVGFAVVMWILGSVVFQKYERTAVKYL